MKKDFVSNGRFGFWSAVMTVFLLAGCQTAGGNVGHIQSFSLSGMEADWIRNGEPIKFEDQLWYPADNVEGFRDSEMHLVGEYRGVQLLVDKVDVRPYDRLYTKFGKNKFRFFEKRRNE